MELYEFLHTLDNYLNPIRDNDSKKKGSTELQKIQNIFGFFMIERVAGDKPLILNGTKDSFGTKIWRGDERLPDSEITALTKLISPEAFEDNYSDEDLPDSTKESIIKEFSKYQIKIRSEFFAYDLCETLRSILKELKRRSAKPALHQAVRIQDGYVVLSNNKRILLQPELNIPTTPTKGEKYAFALLEVFAQDAKRPKMDIHDLSQAKPIYKEQFDISRIDYFKAMNASRQIRDIFSDGEDLFEDTKNQALGIIQQTLIQPWRNGFERLRKTMDLVIEATLYSEGSLGRNGNGFCDAYVKRGIVHMLVNDGKVVWIKSYDTDI
jgi:hypothetical protein